MVGTDGSAHSHRAPRRGRGGGTRALEPPVVIAEEDVIASVADALQYVYPVPSGELHRHLAEAYEREVSPAARDAIGQILVNSSHGGARPAAHVPDTGMVTAFCKVGVEVRSAPPAPSPTSSTRRCAGLFADNPLRAPRSWAIRCSPAATPRRRPRHRPCGAGARQARAGDHGLGQGRRLGEQGQFVCLDPSDDVEPGCSILCKARRRLAAAAGGDQASASAARRKRRCCCWPRRRCSRRST